jgi:heme exporter protein CcmD
MIEGIYNYFDMDGYGIFIWVSFGLSFAVLAGLLTNSILLFRSSEIALNELQAQVSQDEK